MKSLNTKYLTLFFSLLFVALSQAQTPVQDKSSRYQEERRVFIRWNSKWKPGWIYGKGLLGFLHPGNKKYRKNGGDKRNILQMAPTILFLDQNLKQSIGTDTLISNRMKNELLIAAGRTANASYYIKEFGGYGAQFEEQYQLFYSSKINEPINCYGVEDCQQYRIEMEYEYTKRFEGIKKNIKIIKDSYDDDQRKAQSYGQQLSILKEVVREYKEEKKRANTIYKYSNLLKDF